MQSPYALEVQYPDIVAAYRAWKDAQGDDVIMPLQAFAAGWAAAMAAKAQPK